MMSHDLGFSCHVLLHFCDPFTLDARWYSHRHITITLWDMVANVVATIVFATNNPNVFQPARCHLRGLVLESPDGPLRLALTELLVV